MIAADPEAFYGHFLDTWSTEASTIPAEVRAEYLAACGRPEVTRIATAKTR